MEKFLVSDKLRAIEKKESVMILKISWQNLEKRMKEKISRLKNYNIYEHQKKVHPQTRSINQNYPLTNS